MTGSRPLTELEIQSILQAFTGKYEIRNRTLFLLGLNTGARISELLALNIGNVWRFPTFRPTQKRSYHSNPAEKLSQKPIGRVKKQRCLNKVIHNFLKIFYSIKPKYFLKQSLFFSVFP